MSTPSSPAAFRVLSGRTVPVALETSAEVLDHATAGQALTLRLCWAASGAFSVLAPVLAAITVTAGADLWLAPIALAGSAVVALSTWSMANALTRTVLEDTTPVRASRPDD